MNTNHCDKCDLTIPDNVECQLIHLVESHPDEYTNEVLPDYRERIAQLNEDADPPRYPTRSPASDLFEHDP